MLLDNSPLMTGTHRIGGVANSKIHITCDSPGYVFLVNDSENGEDTLLARLIPHKSTPIRINSDCFLLVDVPELAHWGYDTFIVSSVLDPVPAEIPDGATAPETIDDKLKRMFAELVSNTYGASQIDTLEEAMDFDIDDDGIIGPYDVAPMVEEVPVDQVVPSPEPLPPPVDGAEPPVLDPTPVDQGGDGVT